MPRKMKEGEELVLLSVTIRAQDKEWLTKMAAREDRSISALVRRLIKEARENGA